MPEPTSSAMAAGAVSAIPLTVVGVITGVDAWTMGAAFVGALLATRKLEPVGKVWAVLSMISVVIFALLVVWSTAELLPKFMGQPVELGTARFLLAWLVGHYAQTTLLPNGARLIDAATGRLTRLLSGGGGE